MGRDSWGRSTGGDKWTRYTVDDLKSSAPNALATGPFGSAISSRHFTEHGIPVIRGSNLSQDVGTRLNDDGLVFVSERKAREFSRSLVKPGDLVLTCWGTIDQVGLIDDRSLFQEYVISNKQMKLTPDTRKTDSLFLYYLFSSPSVRNEILNQGIGSSVPGFNLGQLRAMTLTLPPLPEQHTIAHILGTLDDKIELNRRMNETLEEMARALFKSWFIDFDPVHAKAALRNHPPNHSSLEGESAQAQATAPVRSGITPPLRGSRQAKGDSPQASRWGDHAATHPPHRWAEIKRQYSPQTLQRAQALRQNQTNAEGLLWHYLSRKQLAGYKFRRQQPIGPYITDFACLSERLLIELDGGQHAERTASDNRRDRFLQEKGYRVLRFWNHEVFENCFGVLESIYAALPHHPPLEGGSKDSSLSGRGSPPPPQPAPDGLASATPPPGGSDWTVERARAYLDGMDPSIAAMFPDRFVNSELGEVPEGWEVGALDDMLELLSGGTPKTSVAEYWDGNIPWYTAKDAPPPSDIFVVETARKITQAGIENSAAKMLPAGTTIITARGTVGRLACLGIPMTMNQTCYGIRGVPGYPDFFTYMNIKMTVNELQQRTHGTIFDTITRQTFKLIDAVIPPPKLAEKFETVVQPIMSHILSNLNESRALTALRNTLLPKLVSGDVRVGM